MTDSAARSSIDHVTLRVPDFAASHAFDATEVAPLGIELGWEDKALGMAEWRDFSIGQDGDNIEAVFHDR